MQPPQPGWSVPPISIEMVAQKKPDFCAPACAQMVLSVMGFTGEPPLSWQGSLNTMITAEPVDPNFPLGKPSRVAAAITCPPTPPEPPPGVRLNRYAEIRTATADEAASAVAAALVAYNTPTAVFVLGGSHWVVIFGGDGLGAPDDPSTFGICNLWLCNPDNGFYGGIPGGYPPDPPDAPGYLQETITYTAFVYSYFTAAAEYPDGNRYAIVCDARAAVTGLGQECSPITPPRDETIEAAIDAILRTPAGAALRERPRRKPRWVKTADGAAYYLAPFVRPDGYADVVRLDECGRYMGIAFRSPYVDLYQDEHVAALVSKTLRWSARSKSGLRIDDALFWHPSRESVTPYNPFYRVRSGNLSAFVSLGGRVVENLHDRLRGEPIVTAL